MQTTIQNAEHELEVLLSAFLDRNFYIKAKLQPAEFQDSRCRKLYEKLMDMKVEDFKAQDVSEWLIEAGRRSGLPTTDVAQATGCASLYHLEQMRLLNKQKKIKELSHECDSLSSVELMEKLKEISAEQISTKHQKEVDVVDYAKNGYREYLKSRKNKENGLYTGRPQFDKITGLERGQLCMLAARPSIGKSAFAENLAYEWAQYGLNVYYASLEMSVEELTHRLYARIAKVSSTKFKYGTAEESSLVLVESELASMTGKINLAYLPGATMDEILHSAALKMPDVLIVDHVDLVRPTGKSDNEAYAIAQMTSAMKAFAGQKNCLVFCLSQFNRESKGEMPELHQLRGSGAKEQDSDVVLILHRNLDPDAEDRTATLKIAKNRSGQVGNLLLKFTPETTTFYE